MTTFIDTSILLDLVSENQNEHTRWSAERVAERKGEGPIVISDMVYSEFCYSMSSVQDVENVIAGLDFERCGLSNEALFKAAKAFRKYKEENRGTKHNVLPDFFIGALAEASGVPLVTRDPARVRHYFPDAVLINPEADRAA